MPNVSEIEEFCEEEEVRDSFEAFIYTQFWLCVVCGSTISVAGLLENSFLISIFTETQQSSSKFVFLLAIAIIDVSIDLNYLLLISVPIASEYYDWLSVYHFWGKYAIFLYVAGQIAPVSQSGMIIAASLDRYFLGVAIDRDARRHSSLTSNTIYEPVKYVHPMLRYVAVATVLLWSIVLKGSTYFEISTQVKPNCTGFAHITLVHQPIDSSEFQVFKLWLIPLFQYYLPFAALLATNCLIVRQFRSEMKKGNDKRRLSSLRRTQKDYRGATCAMIVVISAYLISNSLNVGIAMCEQIYTPKYLYEQYPMAYTLACDLSSILLVLACAIRLPTYYWCNRHFRRSLQKSTRNYSFRLNSIKSRLTE